LSVLKFAKLINSLHQRRHIIVIGSAIIDQIVEIESLPTSGADIVIRRQSSVVGGCALNVASTLRRLGFSSDNAFLVGSGLGSDQIFDFLELRHLDLCIDPVEGDNGWCIALVEADGERTFMTFEGVENDWSVELLNGLSTVNHPLIYISGYQLASPQGVFIVRWLESLIPSTDIVIDFGPRIAQLPASTISRILALQPIITVNRSEAHFLGIDGDVQNQTDEWGSSNNCPIIVRLDSDGAYYWKSDQNSGYVGAFKTDVEDTIGAGDSHAGGLLAGLSAGLGLVDAVRLGNAVASFVVGRRGGASSPDIESLLSHIGQV